VARDEIDGLERRTEQLQSLLDGIREDLQLIRYWRGPKDAMARRSRNRDEIRAELDRITVPDVREDK
jgi:hypothetical protein